MEQGQALLFTRTKHMADRLDKVLHQHGIPSATIHGNRSQVQRTRALADFKAPARINHIDGLRVDWPDGFGLIRASNTTPVLVLRFEGQTEAALQRIETEMLVLLRRIKSDAKFEASTH